MRSNNKYIPSIGSVVLLSTIVLSVIFVNWALGPLSYEEAQSEENKGHQLAKEGKSNEALKHFLNAAKIEDDNISTSRRYRCAGSTASKEDDKIEYFKLSLKYNPNNANAKNGLKSLLQEIRYVKRTPDGWSQGKNAEIVLNTLEKEVVYEIIYFTSSPKKLEHKVKISVNGKVKKDEVVKSGMIYKYKFSLFTGKHKVKMAINETFNPKKLGMSADNRDLGIHFEIKKVEAK